jgi:hypothetical protein
VLVTQVSACRATLGCGTKSRWDSNAARLSWPYFFWVNYDSAWEKIWSSGGLGFICTGDSRDSRANLIKATIVENNHTCQLKPVSYQAPSHSITNNFHRPAEDRLEHRPLRYFFFYEITRLSGVYPMRLRHSFAAMEQRAENH